MGILDSILDVARTSLAPPPTGNASVDFLNSMATTPARNMAVAAAVPPYIAYQTAKVPQETAQLAQDMYLTPTMMDTGEGDTRGERVLSTMANVAGPGAAMPKPAGSFGSFGGGAFKGGLKTAHDSSPPVTNLDWLLGGGAAETSPAAISVGIKAYHGSPHSFDKFDVSKIGTGEGNQSFGHGIYFAENERVAKSYRDSLSEASQDLNIGGKRFDYSQASPEEKMAFDDLYRQDAWNPDLDGAVRSAQFRYENSLRNDGADHPWTLAAKQKLDILNDWKTRGIENTGGSKGHMYEVGINAAPEHFLDWDAPMSEQSPVVRAFAENLARKARGETREVPSNVVEAAPYSSFTSSVVESLNKDPKWKGEWSGPVDEDRVWHHIEKTYPNFTQASKQALADEIQVATGKGLNNEMLIPDTLTGQQFHSLVDNTLYKSPAELSQTMRDAGIAGIRYLDGGSRGMGTGSRNYVVFDDKNIDILRKYGLAGLGIGVGGAAALGMAGQDQAQAAEGKNMPGMTRVTDPRVLEMLNASDAPQSPQPANGQMDTPPSGQGGQMSGMTRVVDPALLEQLNAPETPGVRFAPQGQPGPSGLLWDKDGGRDAQSGELVIAGKPFGERGPGEAFAERQPSQALAAGSSFLSGVPIVGPALAKGAVKAGAYLRDKLYGDPADQTESAVQGDIERSQAAYPKTSTAAGVAGGVVGLAPAVAEAPALFGAGGGGIGARMGIGAATGADIGGLDAAVRSNGDPKSTLYGAGAGYLGGGAAPVIGAGLSRAAHGIADFSARHFSLDPGMSRPAAQILARAAETDGALSPEGLARLREAGPQGMLADAGPATASVLDTAMQRGGPGATMARSAIEQRAAAADRDLGRALDGALGPEQGVHTAETAIRTGSAPARKTAYDAAYAQPIDYSSAPGRALEALVNNHVPVSAIDQANALIRADPSAGPSHQILARIGDNGQVTFERLPDVRQLDYITRGLNDVAAAENGKGALGKTTQLGNTYSNLSKAIRGQLRQAVPEYATALETAAEPIAARNALQFGTEILNPSVPRDVAIETVSHMTRPELMQARGGLRAQIAETLANVRRTIGDDNVDARQAMAAVKILSSDAAREKMALLVGSEDAGKMARSLEQELEKATRALELRSRVATNSRTFGRAVTDQTIKEATAPGVVGQALEGRPIDAPRSILKAITARRPIDYQRREDAVYGELANALTGPRGPAAEGVLERLMRMNAASTKANLFAGMIPFGSATQVGSLALLPSFNQLPHGQP